MADFDELKKMRVVYQIPGMERSRLVENLVYKQVNGTALHMDVYYPAAMRPGEQRPAVLFVHGLGPAELVKGIKNSGQYTSWGQLTSASGLIAVTFNHRSPDEHISFTDVAGDVDALVRHVRSQSAELQIDNERLAIWGCSAGVPLSTRAALLGAPSFVKCMVAHYGPLDMHGLQVDWGLTDAEAQECSATTYLEHPEQLPPMLISKAGLDHPALNAAIDSFIAQATTKNITLDYMIHPAGHHGFDAQDNVPRSQDIIQRTLAFLQTYLVNP